MPHTTTRHLLATALMALTMLAVLPEANAGVRETGKLGIGVGAGTLARGFSLKYFLANDLAVQGVVGVYGYGYGDCWIYYRNVCYSSRRGRQAFAVGADLLSERPDFFSNGAVSVAWNVGGGVGLGFPNSDEVGISVSLVAGLEVNIDAAPIDIVFEYRPTLFAAPVTGFDFTYFTGHVRYFF